MRWNAAWPSRIRCRPISFYPCTQMPLVRAARKGPRSIRCRTARLILPLSGWLSATTAALAVASLAERFVVLIDPSKEVERLGTKMPVPIEVVPMAVAPVTQALERLGATVRLRAGQQKDGPIVTDQGLWVLDATFAYGIADSAALDRALLDMPGVLDHGLFLGLATDVLIGHASGEVEHRTR